MKIKEIEKDKKQIQEKLSELDDEISAINIDYNHNNTLLEEENKKLSPLRDKKMESSAPLQKLNLDMTCLLYTSPSPRDLSTSRMPSSA